jgi:hypothetical protein
MLHCNVSRDGVNMQCQPKGFGRPNAAVQRVFMEAALRIIDGRMSHARASLPLDCCTLLDYGHILTATG